MWSFGCVLIEAAVWVCFGQRGRIEFQQRRRDENNEVAEEQRDLGRSDCFHDGKARLTTVGEVLDLVQRDGRRSDELTPKIVKLVLDHILVDKSSRYNARILSTELGKLVRIAANSPNGRLSRHISTASSAAHSHGSQDFRHSQNYGISDPQPISTRPQHSTLTRSLTIDSMSQNQTSPTERVSTMSMPNRSTSVRVPNGAAESWYDIDEPQGLHRMGGRQLPASMQELSAMDGTLSAYSTITPEADVSKRTQTETAGHDFIQGHIWHAPSQDQTWLAQRASANGTAAGRSYPPWTHSQPSDHRKTTFPDISIQLVDLRRAEGGSPNLRRSLPGEDQAMFFLKQRDHVSLRAKSSRATFFDDTKRIY